MTVDGEPVDDIESLERFFQQCEEKVGGTPYLKRDDAREFLEEVAYRCRNSTVDGVTLAEAALSSRRVAWPAGLGEADRHAIVTELLGGSGAVVGKNGDWRFTSLAAQDYLAARYIFRRHPDGPRWWQPRTRRYLKPRPVWPWPDSGVMLFLAALWWQDTKPAVERQLRRLLDERHRDPNIHFVTELLRRDLVADHDIRDRTVAILRLEVADGEQTDERWTAMVGSLLRLDPVATIDELENVVRLPRQDMASSRRFTAALRIIEHDAARGAANLRNVANNPTGPAQDRFDTAKRIGDIDRELGDRAMRLLVRTPDMRELRADAAIHVGSPSLWRELVEGDRSLPDDARLRVAGELLAVDPVTAVAAMKRFAATAGADATPLRIAEMVASHDQRAALQIATETARSWDRGTDSRVRLDAVVLVGKLDRAQAEPLLDWLSKDPSVTDEVRLAAATGVLERGGPVTALVDYANDARVDHACRRRAAEKVGMVEPATGAQLFVALAKACAPTDRAQLTLLGEAEKLVPGSAADALVDVVMNVRASTPIRIEAVEIARSTLPRHRVIDLYGVIAEHSDNKAAMVVARKVLAMDTSAGKRLMGTLANRTGADAEYRYTAASLAGGHGRQALASLADTAPFAVRKKAATALRAFDERKGRQALEKLVRSYRAGEVRIEAALELSGTSAMEALIAIAKDGRGKDTLRFAALVAAEGLDRKRARQAMAELAEARGISQPTREKIRRHLKK